MRIIMWTVVLSESSSRVFEARLVASVASPTRTVTFVTVTTPCSKLPTSELFERTSTSAHKRRNYDESSCLTLVSC